MKKIIFIFSTTLILLATNNAISQELPKELFIDVESYIETRLSKVDNERYEPFRLRMLPAANASRIYIESNSALKEVSILVTDNDGNHFLSYQLPILSDLDMSLKQLPQGEYIVSVNSLQGSVAMKIVRH